MVHPRLVITECNKLFSVVGLDSPFWTVDFSLVSKRSIWVSDGTSQPESLKLGIIHQTLNLKRHITLYPLQCTQNYSLKNSKCLTYIYSQRYKICYTYSRTPKEKTRKLEFEEAAPMKAASSAAGATVMFLGTWDRTTLSRTMRQSSLMLGTIIFAIVASQTSTFIHPYMKNMSSYQMTLQRTETKTRKFWDRHTDRVSWWHVSCYIKCVPVYIESNSIEGSLFKGHIWGPLWIF